MNLGKTGASFSFGGRGLRYTIGPRGKRTTIGIPGTGLSYTTIGRAARRDLPPGEARREFIFLQLADLAPHYSTEAVKIAAIGFETAREGRKPTQEDFEKAGLPAEIFNAHRDEASQLIDALGVRADALVARARRRRIFRWAVAATIVVGGAWLFLRSPSPPERPQALPNVPAPSRTIPTAQPTTARPAVPAVPPTLVAPTQVAPSADPWSGVRPGQRTPAAPVPLPPPRPR